MLSYYSMYMMSDKERKRLEAIEREEESLRIYKANLIHNHNLLQKMINEQTLNLINQMGVDNLNEV